jgi:predicted Fe-S protein YdhL (DUF1289 family)
MMCLTQLEEQAKACSRGVTGDGWTLEVPIRIQNGCNLREHHMARHRRVLKERSAVNWAFLARRARATRLPALPIVVTLTRLAPPRSKLDDDNNVAGCKAVRDEVAAWLGVDDRSPMVEWRYAQERAKGYAVRIQIEEVGK